MKQKTNVIIMQTSIQKFVRFHNVDTHDDATTFFKSTRRALRREFHENHEHNSRWSFDARSRVHTFMCERFKIDVAMSRASALFARATTNDDA